MYIDWRTARNAVATLVTGPAASLRRFVVVVPLLLFLLVPVTVSIAVLRALDHVFFPGFRNVRIEAPIFVVANPRSGTTLLHRLLSLDNERFTSLRLWQTIVPTVTGYRLVAVLARIDGWLGRPVGRLLRWIERRALGGWDGVHNTGLDAYEEEECYFFYMWASPAVWFAFPDRERLGQIGMLDELPAATRAGVMQTHRTSIQRHLFATGTGARFLTKNVLCTGRLRSMLDVYPDARFVYLVRNPDEAVPSTASMFSMPTRFLAPGAEQDVARMWGDLAVRFYEHAEEVSATLPADRFVTIRYEDLVEDPVGTVRQVYDRLQIPMLPAYEEKLIAATQKARSYERRHEYSAAELGIDADAVRTRLAPIYERYGFGATTAASTVPDARPPSEDRAEIA